MVDQDILARREYKRRWNLKNKDRLRKYYQNAKPHMLSIPSFGSNGRTLFYSSNVTKENRRVVVRMLVNKVLDDCIRNPGKFLRRSRRRSRRPKHIFCNIS
jgi:hypothetical protein